MDVKESLKNYRNNNVVISIAEATGNVNDEIKKLIEEKSILDIAINTLPTEQLMAIDCHYRKGISYESIARRQGYAKSTIKKRVEKGIELLLKILK